MDILRQVWLQQYGVENGKVYWRIEQEGIPPSTRFVCPARSKCTKAKRRTITLHREAYHLALQAARVRENTIEFKREYAKRAGIEGTIPQRVRAFGLRRAKYVGFAKTHRQHVLTATAMNFARISNWLADISWEKTRALSFEKLMLPVVAA